MRVFKNSGLPIKFWSFAEKDFPDEHFEQGALQQVYRLAKLPFAFRHIAVMPDYHTGYGMPIGGVLATKGVVIPNAVGMDIGCGMCAVKTNLKSINTAGLKDIMGKIRAVIPVGFDHHKEEQDINLMPNWDKGDIGTDYNFTMIGSERYCYPIDSGLFEKALYQLGTLGGGNHFIELQKEIIDCPLCDGGRTINFMSCPECNGRRKIDGNIWVMLHSGSRNLGYKVATAHNKIAIDLNKKWYSQVPKEWELAFLPIESNEGQGYIKEMNYCLEFAKANRDLMMSRIMQIMGKYNDCTFDKPINIHHNYATMEHHFGTNVMVHRKGATLARKGTIGIIPGSQGSKSYIVKGLGNPESFMSCSHGAGRLMSRTKAIETLNLVEEMKKMDDLGIVHGMRTKNDLDESSSAYKDIDTVMANQSDLVEIVTELHPIAVIKG